MSKDLTARVRLDTKQAEKALTRMEKKLNRINAVANRTASRGFGSVSKSVSNTNKNLSKTVSLTDVWAKKLNRVMSAYLGIQGLQIALNTSDMITSAENRLNNLNGGDVKQTQETMDKMFTSAQKVRMGYSDMMQNVSKSITLAGDAFNNNVDNAIRFQEIMAEAYAIGGASAAEQSSSMYQMIQGLGSGILQGDELRSVREGAPLAYKAIEEFAQKVLETDESLKKLASEGKITSEIVVAAMMDAGAGMDAAFAKTQMTFAQAWTKIKNTAIKSFEPVLQMLNKGLNSETGQSIINGIAIGIQIIANALRIVFNIIGAIVRFVQNNGKLIASILVVIGAVMLAVLFPKFVAWLGYLGFVIQYYAYVGAAALAAGIKAMIGWLAANWVLLLIILAIAAVIVAVIWLSDSFQDAIGNIVGGIMTAVAFVWNLFLGLVDFILGIVNYWYNIFQSFVNFFANVFKDPIGSIINLFGNLADNVLGVLETIAKAMDKVFGSSLADTVAGWRGTLNSKIEVAANKHGNGKYEEVMDNLNLSAESLGLSRWAYGDAFETGHKWGSEGASWVTDKLSGLTSKLTGGDLPTSVLDGIDNIDGNTGSMADSMELTAEDLSYLRRVAEMEWKKEFTTAAITVDMSNYNTINGDSDLDGIVTKLADKLYEELHVVADGVY